MPQSHLSVEQAEALEKLVRKVQKKRAKRAKLEKDLKRAKQELKEAERQLAEATEDLAPVFRRLLDGKPISDSRPARPARPSKAVMLGREILAKVAGFGQRGFHADDVAKWFAGDFAQGEIAAAVEASLERGLLERDPRGFLRITESGREELAG